jgi:tetratricopeptide (TPR) repeat protein
MAFGLGFNKQKALSSAEKFVQQGKLQNAIAEYEKVRKHDSKDLTVANTIGDLYSRLGQIPNAIACFKAVGDAYAAQGFTVKGIAMYKKITKLQPSVDGSLKLAELYTQQGLFNDARAQYLQVAEDFMKAGELENAVRLFQKVLEMDPENVPMRIRLADAYIKLGKKTEAFEIFSAAAESLRSRGQLAAAEDILQRMLALDPNNNYVLLMRGRAALDNGNPKGAIQCLEKASDIDSQPDGLRDLLKAYVEVGDLSKCTPVAEKLLVVHNDPAGLFVLASGAAQLGQYNKALEIYSTHADRLLAADPTRLLGNLHVLIAHVQGDAGALEKLLALLEKSGESTHVNEAAELLAHACVKKGNLKRARDLYSMLAASEPQNPMHAQNCQKMTARLEEMAALGASSITTDEGLLMLEELEATSAAVDQPYPEPVNEAVRAALTDAELYLSYNLPEKALPSLTEALLQTPQDVRLNQRLAMLHTRMQQFAEAATCCRTLENVFQDAGHGHEAAGYRELAARYEHMAGVTPEGVEVVAKSDPVSASTAQPSTAPAEPEFSIDVAPADSQSMQDGISASAPVGDESSHARPEAAGNPEIAETLDEIRFYLKHFMVEQARSACERLETLTDDAAILDPAKAAIAAAPTSPEEPEPEIAEINADDPATFQVEFETLGVPKIEDFSIAAASEYADHETHAEPESQEPNAAASGHYAHAGDTPAIQTNAIQASATAAATDSDPDTIHADADAATQITVNAAQAGTADGHGTSNELGALVAHLESSVGDSFLNTAASDMPAPHAPTGDAPAAKSAALYEAAIAASAPMSSSVPQPAAPQFAAPQPAAPQPVAPQPELTASAVPEKASAAAAAAAAPGMFAYRPAPVRPVGAETQNAPARASGIDLSQMFGELKHELEEGALSNDEDPETHYNLAVAFREMGLLDEAIAELQKVSSALDRGCTFPQTVQAYTWLAQCFLDKGMPQAAIPWYEKALHLPGLDGQTVVAINYELGTACESAKDRAGALRYFTYVYGANIDYRDVAERIQALKS